MHPLRKRWSLLLAAIILACGSAATSAYAQRNIDTTGVIKSTVTIRQSFAIAARQASKSTVRIIAQDPGPAHAATYGTVITSDGYILTKASEIAGYRKITVKLPGKEVEAKVVGVRESYDLAMLKIDAQDLVPVVLANTSQPSVPPPPPVAPFQRGNRGAAARPPNGPIPAVAGTPEPPAGAIPVIVGEFVVTPEAAGSEGRDLAPKSFGVISVERRTIPFTSGVVPANGLMK